MNHTGQKLNWSADRQFLLAMLAGPFLWALLVLLDASEFSFWWLQTPWTLLMLVVIRPLLEELVFRGLLQGWCIKQSWGERRFAGITIANWLVSLLFTLLHLLSHTPLLALLVMVPSLIFGHFRDRYHGALTASIMLHCFYNAGYFSIYAPL